MIRPVAALLVLSAIANAQVRTPFDAPVMEGDGDSRFVKTLDLDNDGWADAVSAFIVGSNPPNQPYRIVGYYNDHTGRLVRGGWTLSVPITISTFQPFFDQHDAWDVGDLNGDGKQDFVFSTKDTFYAYLSNGTLAPTLAVTFATGSNNNYTSVALADFDQDGDLDVVMNHGMTLEIYDIDLVNGVLVSRSTMACPNGRASRIVPADLTGDGKPDVFAFGTCVVPVSNSILGTPIAYSDFALPAVSYDMRNDVGDIDGDGDLDAITFWKRDSPTAAHGYRILRRISPTQLVEEPIVNSGGPARRLVDVDGDGDLDAVCCGGGSGQYVNSDYSTLRIALNDGHGNFAESIEIPCMGSSAIGGLVDMDHDGRVDFVAGRCVYYNRRPIVDPVVPVVGTGAQTDRSFGDFDGDTDLDFEILPWSVYRNRGDGITRLGPVGIPAPPAGYAHTGQGHHGDWDGDGDEDSLVLVVDQTGIAGLHLLRNQGNGVFTSGGIVAGPAGLTGFPYGADDSLAADVDGDGDLDLVLRSFTTTLAGQLKSGWWRNDGTLGFNYMATIPSFLVLKVVDLDGDGYKDLIGTSNPGTYGANIVLVWARGLGNGALAPLANLSASDHYYAIDIGDLDGDGDRDIVGFLAGTLHPRVLWNQGNGIFANQDFPLTLSAQSPLACANAFDVDGDGRLDFVVGPVATTYNVEAIYLRKADNSGFEEPILQVLSGAPNYNTFHRGVTMDIDSDGDTDFVSYNRCFKNLQFEGPGAGSRVQLDDGTAGSGGIRPVLGAKGPFRVGEVVHIVLHGGLPGSKAILASVTSNGPAPITLPWTTLTSPPYDQRLVPITLSGVPGGPAGDGACDIAFRVPADLAGVTRHYTMVVRDPAVRHGERSVSNTLTLTFGP